MNTYQVVLATDGNQTYSLFLYRDVQWGFESTVVGFNSGSRNNSQPIFLNLPESFIEEGVLSLEETSNIGVGYPGVYMFRIDQNITQPQGIL